MGSLYKAQNQIQSRNTKNVMKRHTHQSLLLPYLLTGTLMQLSWKECFYNTMECSQKNIGEYADFLLRQHILMHYRNGVLEVHLIFDDPGSQTQSPKYFQRLHRDQANPISEDHCCTVFTPDVVIPLKWRENVLNCRKCKRNLVCFLSLYFIDKMKLRPR